MRLVHRSRTQVLALLAATTALTAGCHHVSEAFSDDLFEGPVYWSAPLPEGPAVYRDANASGVLDAGDEVILTFDLTDREAGNQKVEQDELSLSDLRLLVTGDSFGENPTVRNGERDNQLRVVLGYGAALRSRQQGSATSLLLNDASLLQLTSKRRDENGQLLEATSLIDIAPGWTSPTAAAGITGSANLGAAADFNRDGLADCALIDAATTSIYAGDGTGSFTFHSIFETVDVEPVQAVLAEDLNGDGWTDLALATISGLDLWFNDLPTSGSFISGPTLGSDDVRSISAADLDRDGILDLALGQAGPDQIFWGAGDGSYIFSGAAGSQGTTHSQAAADVDGDGDLDLVKAIETEEGFDILQLVLGDGSGGFAAEDSLPIAGTARALRTGDLDGDGALDVALAVEVSTDGPAAQFLLGDGAGGFSPGGTALLDSGTSLELGDLDRDGTLDALVATGAGFHCLLGDGEAPLLGSERHDVAGMQGFVAADFDTDGDLDLLTLGSQIGLSRAGLLQTFGTTRFGTMSLPASTVYNDQLGGDKTRAIAAGDIDRDGTLDLVLGAENFSTGPGGYVEVRRGLGDGSFAAPEPLAWADSGAVRRVQGLALADLDADGDLDIVGAQQVTETGEGGGSLHGLFVFLADGAGSYTEYGAHYSWTLEASAVAVADLDADGDLDILLAGMGVQWDYLFSNNGKEGDGTWLGLSEPTTLVTGVSGDGMGPVHTADIAVADLDNDGDLDILTAHAPGVANTILWNDGGDFTGEALAGSAEYDCRALALGDVDLDGDVDILTGNAAGDHVWLNTPEGFVQEIEHLPSSDTYALILVDINRDAFLDVVVGNLGGEQDEGVQVWLNRAREPESEGLTPWSGFGQEGEPARPNYVMHFGRVEALQAGDFDGDGDVEFIAGNLTAGVTNTLWFNH